MTERELNMANTVLGTGIADLMGSSPVSKLKDMDV